MQIVRDTIKSRITSCSPQEMNVLQSYLSEFDDGSTLLFEDGDILYTGLVPWLEKQGLLFEVVDDGLPERIPIKDIVIDEECLKGRKLRDYQVADVRRAVHYGRGITEAATGSGKTEMAAAAIYHLQVWGKVKTVVYLAPTVFLMEQAANKLEQFGLGKVGRVGGGRKFKPGYDIYCFVVDSAYRALQRRKEAASFIASADMLILDEAHHASAKSWIEICEWCRASYRLAYTATVHDDPEKYSYPDLVLIGLIGPIIYEIRSKELRERGFLADPLVTVLRTRTGKIPVWNWHTVYDIGIVRNKIRNSMIVSLASCCFKGGYKTMIFVGRRKHGHRLAQVLSSLLSCQCCFVHGESTAFIYMPSGLIRRERWDVDDIASYINNNDRTILITTTVLDEGLDVPVINVLIMATGMKKYRRTIQRCGRGMRPKEGHNKVYIFDFWDEGHAFLKRQSEYRLWTYKTEEFDIADSVSITSDSMGVELDVDRKLLSD
jgi:superfamily II DNA or RNA helicase